MRRLRIEAGENPRLHDAARLRAWARADLKCIKMFGREPVAPEGWPPGVDGEEEIDRFTGQLSDILENFEALQQIDTEGVPPTAQPIPLRNVLKEDTVRESLPQDEILANAPQREGEFVRIRAVLE